MNLPVVSSVSPQTQAWFDNNVARAGGPVTRTELDAYLLNWADNNLARSGGPLSDAERIAAAKGIGMPLNDVLAPRASRTTAGVAVAGHAPLSPLMLVLGALLLWYVVEK